MNALQSMPEGVVVVLAAPLPHEVAKVIGPLFFFGKQFHYPLHGEKTRIGPEAAAGPVSDRTRERQCGAASCEGFVVAVVILAARDVSSVQ